MPHTHNVYDTDKRFVINTITKTISTPKVNVPVLVQYDHNSEHITFEADRFVEGHDLSLCDKVEVHYNNVGGTATRTSKGVYEAQDFRLDPADNSKVIFTWILSEKATTYTGTLAYIVSFTCTSDGEVLYRWNTNVDKTLTVSDGINNGEAVEEMYADVLEMWKLELFGIGDTEEARMKSQAKTQQEAIALKGSQVLASIPEDYTSLQASVDTLLEDDFVPSTSVNSNVITETFDDGRKKVTTIDGDIITEEWYSAAGVLTKSKTIEINQNGVIETLTTF